MKQILASLLSITLIASSAQAIPQVLNFQGRLSESGTLSNGNRQLTFRIFAFQTGGTPLFTETRTVTVSSGIFNALIGEATTGGIPLSVFDGSDRFVEVQVGTTVLPRHKMASVGHAYVAAVAQSLAPGATIQFQILEANSVKATTITATTGRFTEGIVAGKGTIYVDGNGTLNQGQANAITITRAIGQNPAMIRTSEVGFQQFPQNTGNLDLIINAGATGYLYLNPYSLGNIQLAQSTVTNTGTFLLATDASLSLFGPAGTIATASSVTASAFFGNLVDAQSARFGTGVNQSLFGPLGGLTFPAGYTPVAPQDAPTKAYVDSQLVGGGVWSKTGSVVTLIYPTDNVVVQSTLTVQGNEFSVGGALLAVTGGNVGLGTTSPAAKLDVVGNAQFGSGAAKTTITNSGDLLIANNSNILLSGPTGTVTTASSVTASAFFGDGSGLTGVSATQVAAANVTPGTFVAGVNLPAVSVLPGSLGSTVIASSIAISAISDDQVAAGANIAQSKIANLTSDLAAKVSKAGDTMTGDLNMSNVAVNLTGPAGNIIGQASVTASGFFGDGSGLTGVSASQVDAAGVLTGSLGNDVIASSIAVIAVSNDQVSSSANIAQSKIANLPADLAAKVSKAGDTMTGALTMSNVAINLSGPAGALIGQSSVTASAFFGDGSNLTGISGPWTKVGQVVALANPTDNVVVQSSLTVQGTEFSIGGSLLNVNSGNVGVGTASPGAALDVVGTARMTAFALPSGAASGLVLTSDSSGNGTWQPASAGGGGGSIPTNMQVFNANGSFTVPTGVTRIMVEVWGGGGGGGSSNNLGGGGGGGGGAGGYGRQFFTVTPGTVINATIGLGGTASMFNAGGTGGTTSFGSLISASGGTGGAAAQSLGGGGLGGTGGTSTATLNIAGGSGGGSDKNGAMGGSAGNGGAGGGGGRWVYSYNPAQANGRPGAVPGGGGGGGAAFDTNSGGVGASGRVLVTW